MKNSNNNWFPSALLLVFVTLKLTGHIDWSWWWVMSPLWITAGVVLGALGLLLLLRPKKRR